MTKADEIRVVSIISRMNVGGPAVLIAELANRLENSGFSHTLITGVCEANEKDYLISHKIAGRIIYIHRLSRSVLFLNEVVALIMLVKVLRATKPDIVHTHMSKAGFLGRIAARVAVPSAVVLHTYHGHLLYGYFGKFKTKLVVLAERTLAHISDYLIGITTAVVKDLRFEKIGRASQWKLIRLGVNVAPVYDKLEARKKLQIEENTFCLIWLGRFAEIKNPKFALEVFQKFEQKDSSLLIMCGGGDLLEECQEFARKHNLNVVFPGWIDDIYRYLPAANLLILTSKNEGFGMVILEAASQKVPTLAADVGGVSEFISDSETGFLSEPKLEHFLGKLNLIANNPSERSAVGLRARELLISQFTVEEFVHNHIALYRSALEKKS